MVCGKSCGSIFGNTDLILHIFFGHMALRFQTSQGLSKIKIKNVSELLVKSKESGLERVISSFLKKDGLEEELQS